MEEIMETEIKQANWVRPDILAEIEQPKPEKNKPVIVENDDE